MRIWPLLMVLLSYLNNAQVISTVDFTQNVVSTNSPYMNAIGVSMYFPEMIPYFANDLFSGRFQVSLFGSFSNIFYQSIHVPMGYKYNCSETLYNASVSCLLDLATNPTITSQMKTYLNELNNIYSIDLGFDMEKSSFSNSKYLSNFRTYFNIFATSSPINIELVDQGNLYASKYNRTYTISDYISDLNTVSRYYYPNGPGLTEQADASWFSQMDTISNLYSYFTLRCVVFHDSSQATISNLLSQNYTTKYLSRRLVKGVGGTPIDLSTYITAINQIKLINGEGIDGVTNSFAAALWALQISIEFVSIQGAFINFYNPLLLPSKQGVFGSGPDFNPSSIYYGLLLAIYSMRNFATINYPTVVGGTSQSIKVYGLQSWFDYKVLIINKDMNPNITGVVNVKLDYQSGMRCIYLSAPNLTSTSNITFAGMSFVGNSSDYVGQFIYYDYYPVGSVYSFNISYSQAVICEQISDPVYYALKRGRSKHEVKLLFLLILLSLLLL